MCELGGLQCEAVGRSLSRCCRLFRPLDQFVAALEHADWDGEVLHRFGPMRVRLERAAAGGLERWSIDLVSLQIEDIAREQTKEPAVTIETDAAKHRASGGVATIRELIKNERTETVAGPHGVAERLGGSSTAGHD